MTKSPKDKASSHGTSREKQSSCSSSSSSSSSSKSSENKRDEGFIVDHNHESGAEEEEEESDADDPIYAKLAEKYNLEIQDEEEEEEEEEGSDYNSHPPVQQQHVDSAKHALRYDAKKSCTLRPVLVDYGLDDPTRDRRKREKQKRNQRKRRESEGDDEVKGKAETDYYIGVYDSMNRIRDAYYKVYLNDLQERVEQQRRDIKKKSLESEDKLARQTQRPKLEKQLEHHRVVHDDRFLEKIAKTETYKIVQYEQKLRQKGKLRYQSELENFWRIARDEPLKLQEILRKEKIDIIKDPGADHKSSYHGSHLSDSFSSSNTSLQDKERVLLDYRPMTGIDEAKESSRPSTRFGPVQTWAVTQLGTAQNSMVKKSVYKPLDAYQKAKLAAQELDRKLPQRDLPPMSCFKIDLGSAGPDPDEILATLKLQRRQKERLLFVKRIRSMYNLSHANAASTKRIMDRHGDEFDFAMAGPDMDTLMSSYNLRNDPQPPLTAQEKQLEEQPWLRHIRHRAIVTIQEESEPSNSVGGPSATVKSRSTFSRGSSSKRKKDKASESPPPALNIKMLSNSSKTVDAKCLSTNWHNYLGVGKSVFAK